ncbi:MAG: 23S rRNA (uracil(1939)-C(5))-methyltransferase RlmD [Ruminococcus sp.]|nr:23S rRNA (uracil(1939)-C(5))-methyltransferase RlmD [Ruminococcus sp.]
MFKKNQIVGLSITGMTREGNGVGRADGIAVFVPGTAVGDEIECRIVKVKSSYCYGIIENLITPSETRVEPECPVSRSCGGCVFQHLSYEEECRLKDSFIRDSFERIGKLSPEYLPFLTCERTGGYRNKAQYPLAFDKGRVLCGFYARRSHRVIDHTSCALQPEVFSRIAGRIREFIEEKHIPVYDEVKLTGLVRHIYLRRGEHSGQIMVCYVVTDLDRGAVFEGLTGRLTGEFRQIASIMLNENPKNTNVILGRRQRCIYGSEDISDIMCSNRISISPLSFYQVNTIQAERLYAAAEELAELKAEDTLLDLYCGAGTIGLSMARRVKKLIGVEVIEDAVENARRNALQNGIDNAEFICGDAGEAAKLLYERGERPDVVICDPARKGCDRQTLEYMAKMSPGRIVYISCDHATCARDCAVLSELGYRTEKVRGVDLFPRTGHVECVALLTRDAAGEQAAGKVLPLFDR